nr:RNA-binding protein Nova-2 isoform X1 [Bactrocera oleae]XP_014086766.1 RNA-binding protein Nova-2 isoform X1 [Bactrocera oleae]XP_036225864.1 RNA-binding protein Nova-2 isoform X1 [Bactrocera oleae]XP_036225873.1 RNA-binding protein Nova-2 isoform X1 [Bactrocera oleae]XP_036225877.1 RNA-binding protein Nova-2 isoform X1 [Bactrocera oleae]XP_036225882.1 RNA-binding protein Nova-2 isoform X1 [Bactrocera oleae]XP_036225885.1 RNA-binding protein Nova-2 isoform X1 [Bactrocera oleae]XP_03622588
MTQPNSPATLQQQLQVQANCNGSAEGLMSNAFDLIGGASAAQQFLNHMDLYAQQQRQQQQQQLNYLQQQQQQLHSQSLMAKSPSTSPTNFGSGGSSNSSSHSNITISTNNLHSNYNQQHHQQQQQHVAAAAAAAAAAVQQHLGNKHSISLTSSPITSPTKSILTQVAATASSVGAGAVSATSTATTSPPSSSPPTILTNFNSQHHFNLHHNNHQMDLQQQQQQQQQQQLQQQLRERESANAGLNSNSNQTNNNNSPNGERLSNAAVMGTITPTGGHSPNGGAHHQLQQQQQHNHALAQHQHHHHQHGNSTSPFKPPSSASCWCYGDSSYHMKILVPAVASGAIIGKGGETIASLQKDSGARVKMSKSHDFYPGTTERVCLITGSVDGIMSVMDFIMDKIREKPDLTTKIIDTDSKQNQDRDKQVKILVPNSTAGMIIGKGGAFIKQIKEESGSYVQISQKPKDISLQERCITIIGDKENNKAACKMILSKIVEDPQSGTCLNVSYADISGPVANFNPTGSPYATNQNAINTSTASLNSTLGQNIGGAATTAGLLINGTGINLSLNLSSPNPAPNLAVATQLLEHIKIALRGSGYSENATNEVCAALGVLAKYGVLGMGVGVPHANGTTTLGSFLGVTTLDQQTAAAASAATASNVFGAVGQVNLEQYTAAAAAAAAAAASRPTQSHLEAAAAAQFDPFRHLSTSATAAQATTPVSLNNNSFGLTAATGTTCTTAQSLSAATHTLSGLSKSPTPGDLGAKDTKNVEIPEVIVGAILGPNGRSLVEIQHVSGANVQISKKGIFAPGTRNRIVTITGQPNAIAKAQYLIEQKITDEETKRARQIPLTTVVN